MKPCQIQPSHFASWSLSFPVPMHLESYPNNVPVLKYHHLIYHPMVSLTLTSVPNALSLWFQPRRPSFCPANLLPFVWTQGLCTCFSCHVALCCPTASQGCFFLSFKHDLLRRSTSACNPALLLAPLLLFLIASHFINFTFKNDLFNSMVYLFNVLFSTESVPIRKTVLYAFLTSLFPTFRTATSGERILNKYGWIMVTGLEDGLQPSPSQQQSGSPCLPNYDSSQLQAIPWAKEAFCSVFLHLPYPLPILDITSCSQRYCSQLQTHREEDLGVRVTWDGMN